MTKTPRLTIGMPAYNGAHSIRATLHALLAQDFEDFQLHIADDGSTDETSAICEEFVALDSRVYYHPSDVNRGATANFNRAFSFCRSEFFMYAADNDIREPSFVSSCVRALERRPGAVLSFCYFDTLWPGGERGPQVDDRMDTVGMNQRQRLAHVLRNLNWCSAIYGVLRAESLRRTRLFKNIWGMDLAVMYQLSLQGEFVKVPEVLLHRLMPARVVSRRRQWEGFHPSNKRRRVFLPEVWLMGELLSSIASLPAPAPQRLQLISDVLRFGAGRALS